MRFFIQVGDDQPLPVLVELVFSALALDGETAVSCSGSQQKMDFGIVPKMFILFKVWKIFLNTLEIASYGNM